jgi:uncharacterized protein YndB with AHSA1/START domain
MDDSDALEVSVRIQARPETVFAYFTDPARCVQWMGSRAELEPRPGGVYRVWMREGVEAVGEFLVVDAPRRLVFTWGWTEQYGVAPGSMRVEVTFEEVDGGTLVLLRHFGLPTDDVVAMHRQGWSMYAARLEVAVTGGDPGPDPNSVPTG